jgi:hypothetical protein
MAMNQSRAGVQEVSMKSHRTVSRIALAVMAAGSLTLAAPAAQASNGATSISGSQDVRALAAPVGKRCGAYLTDNTIFSDLRYWHCGGTVIRLTEVISAK